MVLGTFASLSPLFANAQGCELEEALILGYTVTKIHEMKTFATRAYIFKDYVSKCWQGRQRTLKGSAQNLCFKFAMNSLTGKFGQRSFDTNRAIFTTDYEPSKKMDQSFQEMLQRVVDFTPIFTAEGYNSAIMLDVENEQKGPRYPIYLSAQILAYARVHMSHIMRAANCYRSWSRAIYYTDTDSLLMYVRSRSLMSSLRSGRPNVCPIWPKLVLLVMNWVS